MKEKRSKHIIEEGSDYKALQDQIQSLKNEQAELLKELKEIKCLLLEKTKKIDETIIETAQCGRPSIYYDDIKKYYKMGCSYTRIAKIVGCSYSTVQKNIKKLKEEGIKVAK